MPYNNGHDPSVSTDTPDYGYLGMFGWSCDDWTIWHTSLKNDIGKTKADAKWINAWNAQSFWNVDYSFCKYEPYFHDYISKEDLKASDIIADTGYGGINSVEKFFDTVTNTENVLKYGVPVVVGSALLAVLIIFVSKANNVSVSPSEAGKTLQKHKNGKK